MDMDDYIRTMEKIHIQHGRGDVIAPGIIHADSDAGEFHIKTGGTKGSPGYFGLKANGGFFQNSADYGLPNILGVIYLSDSSNGLPLALLDSVEISKNRTAAASAVAAKHLARQDARELCVCGLGTQGRIQAKAISRVRKLSKIHAYGRDQAKMDAYCRDVAEELGVEVVPATNLAQSLAQSDILVTCTPSREAFIQKSWIQPGTFIAAVGADSPGKHELDAELVAEAKVVPDILAQSSHVGELQHPLAMGLMKDSDIHGELGKVLTGEASGRENDDEIIIYDSTGTALQDVAAAAEIYEKLKKSGEAASFDFFS